MFLKPIIFLVSIILTLSAGFLSANSPRKASLSQAKMSRFTGLMTTLRSGAMQHTGPLANAVVASSKKALSMSAVEASSSTRTSVVNEKYDIVKEDYIKEFDAFTTLYKHKKSGAEVMSVQIDDNNKVFGITFRTPPEDDTGVPHILEHSVLCGSRRYPSKEPFVDLLKGSLQTFLNAFTYPDRTCYPVASQNTKDFYNLINVYLDAVLFPRAVQDPLVLKQEGWHLEAEGPEAPLTYKGVVYNEMKGVYSNPDSLMGRACQQALFPDNEYAVDSGGDPKAIPDLTFEYFQGFHAKYYHPANSRVYFYGDDDPAKRLELLDEYLGEFEAPAEPAPSAITWQPLRAEPWKVVEHFPAEAGGGEAQHMVSVNWLLNAGPLSAQEGLALTVLDHLLCGTPASVLQRTLDESGLGSQFIGGGLDDTLLQHTFSAGLKGVRPGDVDKVEALVLDTLRRCAAEGFPEEAVAAAVNTKEFEMREFNTGSFPRGLSFMLGAMGNWIYDQDPTEELKFEEPLRALKEDLAAGKPVFQDLLRKMLLDNGHRATVELRPDGALEAAQLQEETARLAAIKEAMSETDVLQVIQEQEKLMAAQAAEDTPEAKASLPKLSLEDLDREGLEIPIEVEERQGVTVVTHPLHTAGILYADVGLGLGAVPLADAPLLPLFARLLREAGAGGLDRIALDQKVGALTGGIRASVMVSQKYTEGFVVSPADRFYSHLFLRGKAVAERAGDLFGLVHAMLADANLGNKQRAVEILRETKAQMDVGVVSAGHQFAANRIDARYTTADAVQELTGGLSYAAALPGLLEQAENDWPAFQARLEAIRAAVLKKENTVVNLTGSEEVLAAADPALGDFLAKVPEGAPAASDWAAAAKLLPAENEGFVVPTQVNYVGYGGQLYREGEVVQGSSEVVSRFLRTGYLWDNVRVMGGAYGGFCRFNPISGVFSFLSYRDPNLEKTLKVYEGAAQYLEEGKFDQATVTQAVIGTIGDLDSPMGPDAKGFLSLRRYLQGQSAEDRQLRRDSILATSAEDFQEFGARLRALNAEAKSASITSAAALERANQALPETQRLLAKKVN
mmetsp:Transcript_6887/g.10977  ORF Transcript_6887/g.10977 Transcript_6887/m.10977 type:complete len:1071 (+) Transcript_6887:114-3326(+)